MGKIIKKRIEYGGSSNSAENIKYDDTKNVKEAIDEVKSEITTTVKTDTTLSVSGKAADAAAVGTKLTEVGTEISSLKKSVSDGKTLVANAITAKGVSTATDSTFSTMANNINSIKTASSISPSSTHSYGTSSASLRLSAGTYIVSFIGEGGCANGWDGSTYPGTNWSLAVSAAISGASSYTLLADSGIRYNQGGMRSLTYLVKVSGTATVTTNTGVGGNYDPLPQSYVVASKIV